MDIEMSKEEYRGKHIQEPRINTIVTHHGLDPLHNPSILKEPYDVLITGGQYLASNGRLSNFWSWRRVLEDGTLGKECSGYGNFTESETRYKVAQKVASTMKRVK